MAARRPRPAWAVPETAWFLALIGGVAAPGARAGGGGSRLWAPLAAGCPAGGHTTPIFGYFGPNGDSQMGYEIANACTPTVVRYAAAAIGMGRNTPLGVKNVSRARFSSEGTLGGQAAVYRDRTAPLDARVSDLLGRMTLDEKFWQIYMIPGDLDDSTHDSMTSPISLDPGWHSLVTRQAAPSVGSPVGLTNRHEVKPSSSEPCAAFRMCLGDLALSRRSLR